MQKTKTKQEEFDLEESSQELEQFQVELRELDDPQKLAEGKRKLHELTEQIEAQMRQSRMTLNKLFKNIGKEKGLKKVTGMYSHIKNYLTSQFQESTMESSLRFLNATLNSFKEYKAEIPVHIKSFRQNLVKLSELRKQCIAQFEKTQKVMKAKIKELEDMEKKVNETKDGQKKEELKAKAQEMQQLVQDIDLKLRRYERDLKNANLTGELFLSMKGTYEILLKQVENFVMDLERHKKNLVIIGPAVADVQQVVQTFDKFAQAIDEHKRRDNICVRLASKAVEHITPTIQYTARPWFTKETVKQVKENEKSAREAYKKAFGPNIESLEDYDITTGKVKEDENEDSEVAQ